MSRKNVILGHKAFNAVSATSTQLSAETDVSYLDSLSYHCKFSAANSGEFKVEAQNGDKDSWYQVPFSSTLTITTETEVQILMNELPFTRIRLRWVPSAGSGSLTCFLTSKSKGA